MKYQKQPQDLFCERVARKIFYKSYLFIKFLVILYHKQTYKGAIFSEAAHLFLAASLKKRTFSYAFFLKSRYFARPVLDAIS